MQRMIRSIFILFLLGFFTIVSAQLPPEIRVDAYLLQAEQSIRGGDHNRARDAMQNIRNLQKEHELDLPNEFHFRYAKAADAVDLPEQALESVLRYLAVSGREGQHYLEALALMNKVQTAVSCKGWDTEDYFKTATLEEVTACLDTGIDLNARDDAGATPLHRAAKNTENLDVIKALINAGADIEAQDKDYRTPLYWAVSFNNLPAIKILINAGANKARVKDKWTPLHWAAAYNKSLDLVKSLINTGSNLKAKDKDKRTPLHVAAAHNENPDLVKALIDAGADLKAKDKDKRTPLHLAAKYNQNPDILKILIDAGANLEARTDFNSTPLHHAVEYNGNPAVVQVLIDAGANPDVHDTNNRTPLHHAAIEKNPASIKILVDAGANVNAQGFGGDLPLDKVMGWGSSREKSAVVKLLRDVGARRKEELKKESDSGLGKTATALLGGAAIMYAGKDAEDQEAVTEAVREYMEGVLSEQPDGNINSAGTSSQPQGGQGQDQLQQALLNLENVCGEKYQGNFADNDHYRFYCLAAFNDYCALKRAQSSEAISKLRASWQQNCAVLKSVGADSKCSYCK
ncbi:MAG: ankyrin repeat domain-containing protein [Gemmatimonadetes bacterium]|nr:ankyrin repeat domain-containing protein [Gemmatimonadota bacterium]